MVFGVVHSFTVAVNARPAWLDSFDDILSPASPTDSTSLPAAFQLGLYPPFAVIAPNKLRFLVQSTSSQSI